MARLNSQGRSQHALKRACLPIPPPSRGHQKQAPSGLVNTYPIGGHRPRKGPAESSTDTVRQRQRFRPGGKKKKKKMPRPSWLDRQPRRKSPCASCALVVSSKSPTVAVYSTSIARVGMSSLADEAVCIGEARKQQELPNIHTNIIAAAKFRRGADAIPSATASWLKTIASPRLPSAHGLTFVARLPKRFRASGEQATVSKNHHANGSGWPRSPVVRLLKDPAHAAPHWLKGHGLPSDEQGHGRRWRPWQCAGARPRTAFDSLFRAAPGRGGSTLQSGLYIEKFIDRPRTSRFRLLADRPRPCDSNLGERDCSIQRRHQKLLEESPSPGPWIPEPAAAAMGEAAIAAARKHLLRGGGHGGNSARPQRQLPLHGDEHNRIQVDASGHRNGDGCGPDRRSNCACRRRTAQPCAGGIRLWGHAIECRNQTPRIPSTISGRARARSPGWLPPGDRGVRVDSPSYNRLRNIPPF